MSDAPPILVYSPDVPQPPWPPGLLPDELANTDFADLTPGYQHKVHVWWGATGGQQTQ
jgi:hypothetical protein